MVIKMTITYPVGNSLYLNITNRCTNACEFCIRAKDDGFYADNLWLEREPTVAEICAELDSKPLDSYDELVFCGYGEPTCRLDDMLLVCDHLHAVTKTPIRLNTNGQADLIAERDTAPEFSGRFDTVSISLNAATACDYQKICHSVYGEEAYSAMLTFAEHVKKYVPRVILSVVRGTIPDSDLEKCSKLAETRGVELRIREYIRKEN